MKCIDSKEIVVKMYKVLPDVTKVLIFTEIILVKGNTSKILYGTESFSLQSPYLQ